MRCWLALLAVVLTAILVFTAERDAERSIYREVTRARVGAGKQ